MTELWAVSFYKIKKCFNVLYKLKCYSIINTHNNLKPFAFRAFINKDSLNPNHFTFFNLQTKGLKP